MTGKQIAGVIVLVVVVALVAIGSSGPPTTTKATQKTYTQEETDIRLAAHTWIYLNTVVVAHRPARKRLCFWFTRSSTPLTAT